MTATPSFRVSWSRLSTPPDPEKTSTAPVAGTNAYLTKRHDGSLGLLIRDVTDAMPSRKYEHLDISIVPRKELHIPGSNMEMLSNCLMLRADDGVEAPALSLILDRLFDHSPSGAFSASHLASVLDEVEEIMRRPRKPPSKEEVLGAWGELRLILMLVQSAGDPTVQRAIVSGWEGEVREKLDCRFFHARWAIEVKTTMGLSREHHLHGIGQVTLPPGFDSGTLASLMVEEGEGLTCLDLLGMLEQAACGSEAEQIGFSELLASRILVRGPECEDERYAFQLVQNGLEFYDFEQVPIPGEADGVTPIEWLSDLSSSTSLTSSEVDVLVGSITEGSDSSA